MIRLSTQRLGGTLASLGEGLDEVASGGVISGTLTLGNAHHLLAPARPASPALLPA